MKVRLYNLSQPALIVKAKTGIIYTNQIGGVACFHPKQEGFLVLLGEAQKSNAFDPARWYNEMPALDDALYDEIEAALNYNDYSYNVQDIRVDREAKNEEAWVQVRFRGDFGPGMMRGGTFRKDVNDKPEPEKYPMYEGILTWENCD